MSNHAGENWKYRVKAMAWCGWGSPIGLGLFPVRLAGLLDLLPFAVLGT